MTKDETRVEVAREAALRVLADRGYFPSAGCVPFDVVIRAMRTFAATAHAAGRREALALPCEHCGAKRADHV